MVENELPMSDPTPAEMEPRPVGHDFVIAHRLAESIRHLLRDPGAGGFSEAKELLAKHRLHSHAEEAVKARDREWAVCFTADPKVTTPGEVMEIIQQREADAVKAATERLEEDIRSLEDHLSWAEEGYREQKAAAEELRSSLDDMYRNRPEAQLEEERQAREKAERDVASFKMVAESISCQLNAALRKRVQELETNLKGWIELHAQVLAAAPSQRDQARREGAEEMRERAALWVSKRERPYYGRFEVVEDLRALPIDPPKAQELSCEVCRMKAIGLPTPGYAHDPGCKGSL